MPKLTIVYEDDRCLAVVKPQGFLTVPPPKGRRAQVAGTVLADRLREEGRGTVFPVHRLDRETSGVVLCARDKLTKAELMDVFRTEKLEKTYLGVAQGIPKSKQGRLEFPIEDLGASARISNRGKPATTLYRVIESLKGACVVEFKLLTGRHNQIRLHMSHIGHPLVGERKFARGKDAAVRHKRAALHAACLNLRLPWVASGPISLEAPLAKDLQNLIERLRP